MLVTVNLITANSVVDWLIDIHLNRVAIRIKKSRSTMVRADPSSLSPCLLRTHSNDVLYTLYAGNYRLRLRSLKSTKANSELFYPIHICFAQFSLSESLLIKVTVKVNNLLHDLLPLRTRTMSKGWIGTGLWQLQKESAHDDMPLCGRPRKPRPLITINISHRCQHICWEWGLMIWIVTSSDTLLLISLPCSYGKPLLSILLQHSTNTMMNQF